MFFNLFFSNQLRSPRSKKYLLIITVILILLSSLFFLFKNQIKKTPVQELTTDWAFILKDHSDQYVYGEANQRIKNIQPDQSLIMQQVLTEKFQQPEVVVKANHQWLSVFLGDQLLYQYAPHKDEKPGLLQTTIPLPQDYQSQKLRIVTKTPYEYYAGIPAQIFIGESAELDRYFILRSFPQMFLLLLVLLLLFSTVIMLFFQKSLPRIPSTSWIQLALITLIGLQAVLSNISAQALFPPSLLSIFSNLTTLLLPVCLTAYYLLRTKKYRKYYQPLVIFQHLLLALGLIGALAREVPLPISVQVFSGFYVFMTLYTAVITLFEVADHNHFFVVCSPGIVMAAFIHCFFYLQLFAGAVNLTTDWPMILFSCLMVLICGYAFWETYLLLQQQRKNLQAEKKAHLLAEEKQRNLLTTFSLLAKQGVTDEPADISLEQLLVPIQHYYQKEFRKQGKFFSCQVQLETETTSGNEVKLALLLQLLESFLIDSSIGTVDLTIRQVQKKLLIESTTSAFIHHIFDEAVVNDPVDHQNLEQSTLRSNGKWQWHRTEKNQYFKITLIL